MQLKLKEILCQLIITGHVRDRKSMTKRIMNTVNLLIKTLHQFKDCSMSLTLIKWVTIMVGVVKEENQVKKVKVNKLQSQTLMNNLLTFNLE